jgi:hypothetical protein
MKYIIIALALFAYPSLFSQSMGRKLDSVRMSKMTLVDTLYLQKHLDSDLEYIHSLGTTENKSQHISNIVNKVICYDSFQFLRTNYKRKSDYLIGIGEVIVYGKYKSSPFTVKLHFTNIYRKSKRIYRLLYWQSTKMNDL